MSSIQGKRILVLEDDVLIALDAAGALEEEGAIVLGPVHRISAALALLEEERPDGALLDVNIAGTTSADVAQRLSSRGVPFVLATGYGGLSGIEGSRAVVDKPYTHQQLRAAVSQLFSG
jgi:CheY-like chemotaxis protein